MWVGAGEFFPSQAFASSSIHLSVVDREDHVIATSRCDAGGRRCEVHSQRAFVTIDNTGTRSNLRRYRHRRPSVCGASGTFSNSSSNERHSEPETRLRPH